VNPNEACLKLLQGHDTAQRGTQLLIAGGDRRFADSLASSFSASESVEIVAVAYGAEQAVEYATALHPDAVLIEPDRLGAASIEALHRIKALEPPPQIILLAQPGSESLRQAAEAGMANAYVVRQHAASVCRIVLSFVLAAPAAE
jgi:DNA-binding NarL/FixJ family response regulator